MKGEQAHSEAGKSWRRAVLRLVAYLLSVSAFAVVSLGLFEGALRLSGYGATTRPFLTYTFAEERHERINPSFYGQFFSVPPYMMVDWDEFEFVFPAEKAPNVVRIFVFGGSAAHGDPDPMRGFPRQLEYMLRATISGIEPEVHTVAFPAANSHVMRALAAACARMQPDFFIVYMGNNEFAGPFSDPRTGRLGIVSPRTLIQARIALSDLRIVQWLNNVLAAPLNAVGLSQTRCHPFAPETPPLQEAAASYFYDNFAENLEDICHLGEEAGARVILCTVASNVRHWRPLGSDNDPGLAEPELAQWRALLDEGRAAEERQDWKGAAQAYERALEIDDDHAQLHYRYATCCWRLSQFDAARIHFYRARDLDPFHWRADGRLNALVLGTAAKHADCVLLADANDAIARRSPHRVPGCEFFHDYVHLNFDGHYEIARSIFNTLAPLLSGAGQDHSGASLSPPTREACRRAFAVNAAEELATLLEEDLYNYVEEGSSFEFDAASSPRAQLGVLRERMLAEPDLATCYRTSLSVFPEDRRLRQAFTRILLDAGNADQALDQARRLQADFPFQRVSHELLAEALLAEGRMEEATATMRAAERLYPGDALTAYASSAVYARAGMPREALRRYKAAADAEPYYPSSAHDLAIQAYEAFGDWEKARDLSAALLRGFPLLEAVNHRIAPLCSELDALLRRRTSREERRAFWDGLAASRPGVLVFHLYAAQARGNGGADLAVQRIYQDAVTVGGGNLEEVCAIKRRAAHYLALIDDAQTKGDLPAVAYFAWRQSLQPSPRLESGGNAVGATAGYRHTLSLPPYDDATLLCLAEAFLALGRFEEAVGLSRCIVDTGSRDARAHELLVHALLETGRVEEAAAQRAASAAMGVAVSRTATDGLADTTQEPQD